MTERPLLLETENLSVRFGAVVAVDRISVQIHQGEIVGLIGTNGAGKTTFINMVTGYLPPSEGRILLGGRDVTGRNTREMVGLGVARSFQVPQLFGEMTVREHLVLSLALAAQRNVSLLRPLHTPARHDEVEATLVRFGLQGIADRPVSSVPQGQRKLIDIAMAMALKPSLLFLDEPTSGVSSAEKVALMDTVFAAIRAQGSTVLFVEHDMDIVARYVTRLMAFRDGKLLADGVPDEVMNHAEVTKSVLRRREVPA